MLNIEYSSFEMNNICSGVRDFGGGDVGRTGSSYVASNAFQGSLPGRSVSENFIIKIGLLVANDTSHELQWYISTLETASH